MSVNDSIFTVDNKISKDVEWPSVLSNDPNERKLARRERIERRKNAFKVHAIRESGGEVEEQKEPLGIQMEKSAGVLETFLTESQEYLENVRIANETREVDRRESEGIGRKKVMAQLEAEAAEAQKQFNDIAGKWSSIQNYKDPLHIHEDILLQKIKCDDLIKQKDELIETLKKEVKLAEAKFTRDQNKQNQDIRILAQRIEKQINFMKKAYNTEFMLIDQVISEEKQKMIDKSNEKWEELFQKRNQEEIELSEYKLRKQEEMNEKIENLYAFHEDQFRTTKIQLELDIQFAQNEFERIKSLALSNSERLDYNYEILKRRENENLIIKNEQKRRISKLQEVISKLRSNLSSYRTKSSKQIDKIKDDIQKLHKNIVDIDAKADLFAETNEKKFYDVWHLNTTNCNALLNKIAQIDQLLHEQQMGVLWMNPIYKHSNTFSITSARYAGSMDSSFSLKPLKSYEHLRSMSASSISPLMDVNDPTYNNLLQLILKATATKSGFLTEKCLKSLINEYEDDNKTLVTLSNVFISLGIKSSDDIDTLVEFFLPYCYCPVCTLPVQTHDSFVSTGIKPRVSQVSYASKTSFFRMDTYDPSIVELGQGWQTIQEADDIIDDVVNEVVNADSLVDNQGNLIIQIPGSNNLDEYGEVNASRSRDKIVSRRKTQRAEVAKLSCKYNHPLVISSVYVLSALKDFVIFYHQKTEDHHTVEERLSIKRYTPSRLIEDREIEKYWKDIRRVFNSSYISIWDKLCEGLLKYLEVLKDRKIASEEVLKLRQKNKDLKRLLASYMDHTATTKTPCGYQFYN